jgi:hypothetical protein
MNITVNELMVLMRTVRERINGLDRLRQETAVKTFYGYGSPETKMVEPQFDVKVVDQKIMELQYFLYLADAKVKASNAVTKVEINTDVDNLLKPIG